MVPFELLLQEFVLLAPVAKKDAENRKKNNAETFKNMMNFRNETMH